MKKSLLSNAPLKFALAIVSLGGVGYIKPASATWGSFATMLLLILLGYSTLTLQAKFFLIVFVFFLGWLLSDYILRKTNLHDPHFIVIDEVVGMLIVALFLESHLIIHMLIGFAFFRLFDIWKLWPASYFDRQKSAFAVMIDDVFMAIPALLCAHILIWFFQYALFSPTI